MISNSRLAKRKSLPRALGPWTLDSGGFSELSIHGKWTMSVNDYGRLVKRYRTEIGNMVWAAQMDWMCEPWIVKKTGLSVENHQQRTIDNYRELEQLAPETPWLPVLQGWTLDDYHRHVDAYYESGVDLCDMDAVGLGSICRRQATKEAAGIVRTLYAKGIKNLHGFGFKTLGLQQVGPLMSSSDSMAWSYAARRSQALSGCTHKSCANCQKFALRWRERVIARIPKNVQGPLL